MKLSDINFTVNVDDRSTSIPTVIITWTRNDVYHSDHLEITEGKRIVTILTKIQMNKSSKFYSMMTVQRFEQQTDEITIIAPSYTVIINQNSDRFNFFF